MIKNSSILFISVKTFNYEKFIIDKLETLGARVMFFDERPMNNFLVKGIIRLKKELYSRKINKYYLKILSKIKEENFDFLFIIKGEVVPSFFLVSFKKLHPNTKLIYYTWDSFQNNPYALENIKYFDKKFSFDPVDSENHNLSFRPLFFIDPYSLIKEKDNLKIKNRVLFIGTAHSDRYTISQNVTNWCKSNEIHYFNYYYISNFFVFIFKKLFDKSFKKFEYKNINFKSLKIKEIYDLYSDSDVVLDINHPDQAGLTMRTFEALGSGKKLITTNENIRKYIFYNTQNILIIDRTQTDFPISFFDNNFKDYNEETIFNMSIEGWLRSIFENPVEFKWLKN